VSNAVIENIYWVSPVLGLDVIVVRLIAAALLGAALGIEREAQNRDAGLKTHMLTAIAAATFTIVTFELFMAVRSADGVSADPLRVIEAVTAGVAFIAAGAIIRNDDKVRGLTTGAGMWLAGAIGIAAGAGHLMLAAIAAGLGFLVLTVVRWIQRDAFPDND
jgi:putative Mg2+ transporter-C (MgtC) family protein